MKQLSEKELQLRALRAAKAEKIERALARRAGKPAADPTQLRKLMKEAAKKMETKGAIKAAKKKAGRPKERDMERGDKIAGIHALLTRPAGCTAADILSFTGWPTVSVPQVAASAGLKLSRKKEGRALRYFGTPKPAH